MGSVTASCSPSLVARASLVHSRRSVAVVSSSVLGLPAMTKKNCKVRCSMKEVVNAGPTQEKKKNSNLKGLMGGSVLATAMMVSPAMALVDERISTEGTGLPLGLSNNILGWVMAGVFATIWALYYTWTTTLEEDEESGLSL